MPSTIRENLLNMKKLTALARIFGEMERARDGMQVMHFQVMFILQYGFKPIQAYQKYICSDRILLSPEDALKHSKNVEPEMFTDTIG